MLLQLLVCLFVEQSVKLLLALGTGHSEHRVIWMAHLTDCYGIPSETPIFLPVITGQRPLGLVADLCRVVPSSMRVGGHRQS